MLPKVCSSWRERRRPLLRSGLVIAGLALASQSASAKDPIIAGVMVYNAPSGPAYVQFTGLLINGKRELRACTAPSGSVDKTAYNHGTKLQLLDAKSMSRKADGSLEGEIGASPVQCILPGSVKYEKPDGVSMSELVDTSSFTAQVTGSLPAGTTEFPVFSKGARIFFVSNTDPELAAFLLAQFASAIPQWRTYLAGYSSNTHTPVAKKALETLLLQDGQTRLAVYRKSLSGAPAYDELAKVRLSALDAVSLEPADPEAVKLQDDETAELTAILTAGQDKFALYSKALADGSKGYANLATARTFAAAAKIVDAANDKTVALLTSVTAASDTIEADMQSAETKVAARHYDDGYATIRKYVFFQDEEPRIKAVVQATYRYHMDEGSKAATNGRWTDAVREYTAADTLAGTDASKSALVKAGDGLIADRNRQAAKVAEGKAAGLVDAKDYIHAYDTLADLPKGQVELVSAKMKEIEPFYIASAQDLARKLQQGHPKIVGRGDEDSARLAYALLERVGTLIDSQDVDIRLNLLGDAISAYYVNSSRKYMAKPVASGVGLAWCYLNEASVYRQGLESIRDERAKDLATYNMKSHLSLGVTFRDQTSHRDSVGFAEQLQDAIATGLDTSKLPVRVIRSTAPADLQPNYRLVGEILEHRPIRTDTNETLQSHYRFGQRDIPNPDWNRADIQLQEAEAAVEKLAAANRMAAQKNNKKQIEDAEAELTALQAKVAAARNQENTIAKTIPEDVIRPYSYVRKTIDMTNVVEVSFRIVDSASNTVDQSVKIVRSVPKKYTVLENLKSDDTDGLHALDSPPDEGQLMTDVEIAARTELVKAAYDHVQALPAKIYEAAKAREQQDDNDGAAELYVLYLNSTDLNETPERTHAIRFLGDIYNIRTASKLNASVQ